MTAYHTHVLLTYSTTCVTVHTYHIGRSVEPLIEEVVQFLWIIWNATNNNNPKNYIRKINRNRLHSIFIQRKPQNIYMSDHKTLVITNTKSLRHPTFLNRNHVTSTHLRDYSNHPNKPMLLNSISYDIPLRFHACFTQNPNNVLPFLHTLFASNRKKSLVGLTTFAKYCVSRMLTI